MSDFSPPYESNSSTMEAAQPYNREAEEAVLGAVLVNPEVYYDVSQILHPEDFYIVRNRWVWEVFVDLHERRVPIDYLTVEKELETKGQLFEIGGAAYLTALITQTPTSLHASAYAKMVEETSLRRRMLASANDMARLAFDQHRDIDTLIGEAEKGVFELERTAPAARPAAHQLGVGHLPRPGGRAFQTHR